MIPQWLKPSQEPGYKELGQESSQADAEGEISRSNIHPSQGKKKLYIAIAIYTFLFTSFCLAAGAALSFTTKNFGPSQQHGPLIQDCGKTPSEAREKGCRFDIMSFSWLPPDCYDAELTNEFDRHADWHWFKNQMGTKEVSKEVVLKGETAMLFVNMDYHRAHCTFMWKKLHRALAQGRFVDNYIGNYNHTRHCEHMLLENVRNSGLKNTVVVTKFPRCDSKAVFT